MERAARAAVGPRAFVRPPRNPDPLAHAPRFRKIAFGSQFPRDPFMRRFAALAALALVALPAAALAQSGGTKFEINQVRFGYPPGAHSGETEPDGSKPPL